MSNFADTTGLTFGLLFGIVFGVNLAVGCVRALVRLRRFSFEVRCSISIESTEEFSLEVTLGLFKSLVALIAEAKGLGGGNEQP